MKDLVRLTSEDRTWINQGTQTITEMSQLLSASNNCKQSHRNSANLSKNGLKELIVQLKNRHSDKQLLSGRLSLPQIPDKVHEMLLPPINCSLNLN